MKRIEAVLAEAGHDDFYDAAGAGDMAAVRALVEPGEGFYKEYWYGCTPVFGAAEGLKVVS